MTFWKRLSFFVGLNFRDWTRDARLGLVDPPFRCFAFGVRLFICGAVFNYNAPDPSDTRLRTSVEIFWLPTSWRLKVKEGDLVWRKHKTLWLSGRHVWLEDLKT